MDLLNLFHSNRFKIGIISYYYPYKKASTSGVGTHVYNLVTHLSKLGCEVHVFTFSDKKDEKISINVGQGKIVIHFLGAEFNYEIDDPVISKRIKYSIFQNRVLEELSLEHSRRSFKVLHTHGWLTSSAFTLKYLYNLPWVHTVHALERNRLSSMTKEEKKLYRMTSWIEDTIADSDKLIAVSQSTSKELVRAFPKVSKKIEVIPNGVDLNLFTPSDDSRKKHILSISRFSKEKGIDLLPDIIEDVLSNVKDAKFTLIVQETSIPTLKPIQDKFIELASKYNERFNWVSKPLTPVEIAPFYKESDIYLQTSYYETFGLCILEGMASGNAIVATNVGGVPEVVGKSGILVKPNSKEISQAIIKILNSDRLRKKMRNLSIERSKKFDWPIIAKDTLEIYKKIIERKKEITENNKQ